MQTISSQRYIDEAIVEAKLEAGDFVVAVSPEFAFDGQTFRVVLDGHHSLEAAKLAGVEPEWMEQDSQDNDKVSLLARGKIDDFLALSWMDSDWYDVATGADVW